MATQANEFRRLLEQLADETKPIAVTTLHTLSDLHGEQLDSYCEAFDGFSPQRKRRVLAALQELAEASFDVTFDAIFLRCLDDLDEEVRSIAVDGLWENESPSLVGLFLTMLRTDPSPRVRASAATALSHFVLAGELEHLEAGVLSRIVSELLTVLDTHAEDIEVRRRALEAVAYACVPEVIQALEVAYYDDNELMRQSAVLGMGRSCDRRWGPVLLEELESDSPAMRYEAALACGELMLPEAVPGLGRLLHDRDREVAQAAIWALGQTGGDSARQLLIGLYDGADEDTRSAIDDALAEQDFADSDLDLPLYDVDESDEEDWDLDSGNDVSSALPDPDGSESEE